mmetsp:Transcript_38897/g.34571  ORF Transcript_38897/g.34571 Transcript_38897/m.34571 type:complete len:201 (-) Transcript_38897:650-1252(-)
MLLELCWVKHFLEFLLVEDFSLFFIELLFIDILLLNFTIIRIFLVISTENSLQNIGRFVSSGVMSLAWSLSFSFSSFNKVLFFFFTITHAWFSIIVIFLFFLFITFNELLTLYFFHSMDSSMSNLLLILFNQLKIIFIQIILSMMVSSLLLLLFSYSLRSFLITLFIIIIIATITSTATTSSCTICILCLWLIKIFSKFI